MSTVRRQQGRQANRCLNTKSSNYRLEVINAEVVLKNNSRMPRLMRRTWNLILGATILRSSISLVILMPSTISLLDASQTHITKSSGSNVTEFTQKQPENVTTTKVLHNKTTERPNNNVSSEVIYTIEVNGTDLDFGESQLNVTRKEAPAESKDLNSIGATKKARRRPFDKVTDKRAATIATQLRSSINETTATTPMPKDTKESKLQRPTLTQKSRKFLKKIKDKRKLRRKNDNGAPDSVAGKNMSTAASYNHENWISFQAPNPATQQPATKAANSEAVPQAAENRDHQVFFDDGEQDGLDEQVESASDNKLTTEGRMDTSSVAQTTKAPAATNSMVLLREQSSKASEDEKPIVSKSTTTMTTINDGKKKAQVMSKSAVLPPKLRQKIIEQFVRSGGDPQNIVVSDSTITTTSQSKKKTITTVYKIVPSVRPMEPPLKAPMINKIQAPKRVKSVVLKGDEYDFDIDHDEILNDEGGLKGGLNELGGSEHKMHPSSLGSLIGGFQKPGKFHGGQRIRMKRPRKVKKIMITRTEVPHQAFLSDEMEQNSGENHGDDLGEFYQGPHESIFGKHNRPPEFGGEQKNTIMDLDAMVLQNNDKTSADLYHMPGGKQHQMGEFQSLDGTPEFSKGDQPGSAAHKQANGWPMAEQLSYEQPVDVLADAKDVVQGDAAKSKHLSNFREVSSTSKKTAPKTKAASSPAEAAGQNQIGSSAADLSGPGEKSATPPAARQRSPEGASGKTRRKAEQQHEPTASTKTTTGSNQGNDASKPASNREQKSLDEAAKKFNRKSVKAKVEAKLVPESALAGEQSDGKKGAKKVDSLEELKRVVAASKRTANNNGGRGAKGANSTAVAKPQSSRRQQAATSGGTVAPQQPEPNANERNENLPPVVGSSSSASASTDASQADQESEAPQQPDRRLPAKGAGSNLGRLTAARLPGTAAAANSRNAQAKIANKPSSQTTDGAKVNVTTETTAEPQSTSKKEAPNKTKTHNIMMLIDFGPQDRRPQVSSQVSYADPPPTDVSEQQQRQQRARVARDFTPSARLEAAATRTKSETGRSGNGRSNNKWPPSSGGQPASSESGNDWRPIETKPRGSPAVSVQIYNNHIGTPSSSVQSHLAPHLQPSEDHMAFEGDTLEGGSNMLFDGAAASHGHPIKAPLLGTNYLDIAQPSTPQYDNLGPQIPAPFHAHLREPGRAHNHAHLLDPILPDESASTNQMVRQVINEIAMAPVSASSAALAAAASSDRQRIYTTTSVHDATSGSPGATLATTPFGGLVAATSQDDAEDDHGDGDDDNELLTSDQLTYDAMVTPSVESFAARRHHDGEQVQPPTGEQLAPALRQAAATTVQPV